MKISIAVIVLLASTSLSEAAPHSDAEETSPAIIGGSPADIANFPFQLNMRFLVDFVCGASIISPQWALTAAHCFDDNINIQAHLITFRAGSADRSAGGIIRTADYYKKHDDYDIDTNFMDVAVVHVTEPFAGPNIAIIPLAPEYLNTPDGSTATVSGWGLDESGQSPIQLLYVEVPIVNQDSCYKSWIETPDKVVIKTLSDVICAGKDGRDSCDLDSGGPLTSGELQIGIVSFGAKACGGPLPGVYTRVSHPSIRSFIFNKTRV